MTREPDQPSDLLSDEELHARIAAMPECTAALEQALPCQRDPSGRSPGLRTAEELRQFLRKNG